MISYEKLIVEEDMFRAFKDNPNAIGIVVNSYNDDEVTVTFPVTFKVPSKYAKAVLKDYLVKELT